MIVLVRDEDPPTVAAAITARADEEGLEAVDVAAQADDPLAMLAVLAGPRVFVSSSHEQVVVAGLESLDVATPEEWGTALSAACESEVVVVVADDAGVVAWVFDGGELDERVDVRHDASGRTTAERLADFAASEEGRRDLERGLVAPDVEALFDGVLRCLGATSTADDTIALAFRDPLAASGEEPSLVVEPLPAASLEGRVGEPLASMHESVFGVTLAGVDEALGVRLELDGDALSLAAIDSIDVWLRVRGAHERERRTIACAGPPIVVELPDAFLERADAAAPAFDPTDLFGTMQNLMSAGEDRVRNTIGVAPRGTGRRAGEGALVLRAYSLGGALGGGEAAIPLRVRP